MRKLIFVLFVCFGLVMVGMALAYHFGGLWGLLGAIAIGLVLLWFSPKLVGWVLLQKFKKMLRQQGVALRGATIEVHSIAPAEEPDEDDDDDEDEDDWANEDWNGDDDNEEPDEDEESDDDDNWNEFEDANEDALIDPDMDADPGIDEAMYDGPRNWLSIELTVYPALHAGKRASEYQPWLARVVTLHGPEVKLPIADPEGFFGRMADTRCVVHHVEVWQDDEWLSSDEVESVGPQRIRLLAGIHPGLTQFDVMYFTEKIGAIKLQTN